MVYEHLVMCSYGLFAAKDVMLYTNGIANDQKEIDMRIEEYLEVLEDKLNKAVANLEGATDGMVATWQDGYITAMVEVIDNLKRIQSAGGE